MNKDVISDTELDTILSQAIEELETVGEESLNFEPLSDAEFEKLFGAPTKR